jgi:hypothetical protein
MPAHSSLTGADIHEPKGADTASVDTVYVSDGGGSGTWEKLTADSLDETSVKNVNKFQLLYTYTDIGTAKSIYIPIPQDCTLDAATAISQTTPTTSSTILTFRNNGASVIGTVTITTATAPASFALTTPVDNTFTAGTYLSIETDGGAANTPDAILILEFTLT